MDDARALLDQLMGKDRHLAPDKQRGLPKFTDDEMCRSYMMGLCPHVLFTNTKYDIGPCKKEHDDRMKEQFEGSKEHSKYRRRWRKKLIKELKKLLTDVDRRIAQNKAKIAHSVSTNKEIEDDTKKKLEKARKEMDETLKQAQGSAEEGMVEESKELMAAVEMLKKQVEELSQPRHEKYKKELICEVCGVIVDSEEAAAVASGKSSWHEKGRQHTGFKAVRETIEKLQEEEAKDDGKEDDDASSETMDEHGVQKVKKKNRGKSRSKSKSKSKKRSRSNKRGRDEKKKDEKGKESRRKRSSSSRSKKDRSRSRDRKKRRSRSRDRRRSPSRKRSEKRRSRSRSRRRR